MRLVCLILALVISTTLAAEDTVKKKKSVAKKQLAHKKPTPEQIRKFYELQKRR